MKEKPAKKTCPRCKGKGFVDSIVAYCGIPGTCFNCEGRGWVYTDKFIERFGTKGVFYGASWEARFSTIKMIGRGDLSKVRADSFSDWTFVEITEEQARKFFAKYGERFEKQGLREAEVSRDARAVLLFAGNARATDDAEKRAEYEAAARKFADRVLQAA